MRGRGRTRGAGRHPHRHVDRILSALVMMSAACSAEEGHSPQVPAKHEDAETRAARLMADSTLRILGVVDVTDAYPDPE